MGKERTPEQKMGQASQIDRIIVMTAGQVKVQDLDAIEIGDIKVTSPDGTVTEIAGMTFKGRRDYSGFKNG